MGNDDSNSGNIVLTYNNFKAWWDVMLDYMVTAAGVIILLIFSRIATYETGMLICTHPGVGESYGYSESRYINSRCCRESNAWALIFYPYVMFFTWMIISTIHLTWLKIPAILSKMEGFSEILNGIFSTTPINYRDPNKPFQITKEFVYDEENSKTIDRLLNRLQYLLTDKPYLRRSYILKHILVMIFCLISLFFTFGTMASWAKYDLSFECHMSHDLPIKRGYPDGNPNGRPTLCHLNSGFFILFTIHFDALVRIIMICLSAIAMGWIYKDKWKFLMPKKKKKRFIKSDNNDEDDKKTKEINEEQIDEDNDERVFGEADSYLSGLPSYVDLLFWIELLKRNSHDGNLMYNSIRSCIRTYCKQFRNVPRGGRRLKVKENDDNIKNNDDQNKNITISKMKQNDALKLLQDNVYYVNLLCKMLGFIQMPNSMEPEHLFDCLDEIRDSLGNVVFPTGLTMREEIANEIEKFPDVYKTIIDEDLYFPDYETYCSRIRNKLTYGSRYVLLAAATILRIRIVLIHFSPVEIYPEVYNPVRQTVIMSQKKGTRETFSKLNNETSSLPVKFLTFIEPYFYNNTEDCEIDADWPHIVLRRSKYSINYRFRNEQKRKVIREIGEFSDIGVFCKDVLSVKNPDLLFFQ